MGMGHNAAFAETVEEDFVKQTCPTEFQSFIDALDEIDGITIEHFARDLMNSLIDDSEDGYRNLISRYDELCSDFCKKTGIIIFLSYHDSSNDGDRYDEVDGHFWCLDYDCVYQKTPAAIALGDKITRKFYVQFG
jgi:hypothetical protein